jgi:hypothetical protein
MLFWYAMCDKDLFHSQYCFLCICCLIFQEYLDFRPFGALEFSLLLEVGQRSLLQQLARALAGDLASAVVDELTVELPPGKRCTLTFCSTRWSILGNRGMLAGNSWTSVCLDGQHGQVEWYLQSEDEGGQSYHCAEPGLFL